MSIQSTQSGQIFMAHLPQTVLWQVLHESIVLFRHLEVAHVFRFFLEVRWFLRDFFVQVHFFQEGLLELSLLICSFSYNYFERNQLASSEGVWRKFFIVTAYHQKVNEKKWGYKSAFSSYFYHHTPNNFM